MIIQFVVVTLVDLKVTYFPLSLKNVRIWLESKTHDELKTKIRRFKIEIIVFFLFVLISIVGISLAIYFYADFNTFYVPLTL